MVENIFCGNVLDFTADRNRSDKSGVHLLCSDHTLRNDLWMSDDRASAFISTAKVFLHSKSQPLSLGCDFVF